MDRLTAGRGLLVDTISEFTHTLAQYALYAGHLHQWTPSYKNVQIKCTNLPRGNMDDDASLRVTVTAIGQHTSTPNSSIAEISPSLHEYQHQRPSNNVSLLDDFASVALRHSSLSSPQGISSPQPSFRVGTSPGRPGHQKDLPCEDETLSLYAGHSEPEAMILSGASVPLVLDEFAINPRFVELQRELRSLLFTSAHSNAPTRAASPVVDEHPGVSTVENRLQRPYQAISSESIKQIVSTNQRLVYLKNYIVEVAPWVRSNSIISPKRDYFGGLLTNLTLTLSLQLDMHDVRRTFGNQLLILAQTSSPLVYAILAISARQIERKQGLKGSYESLQLYQNAIELLTPQLEARDPNIMATCVVLCCLEMMSASPTDWRRHLDGCAALFDSFGIHGFSGGLLQAVFWCYARMGTSSTVFTVVVVSPALLERIHTFDNDDSDCSTLICANGY